MSFKPAHLVFLTSFSQGCFRAIPAVAQMVDDLDARLTILHAYDPSRSTASGAQATLDSFFPEADRFVGTRRVLYEGSLFDALRDLGERRGFDLLIAPSVDRVWPLRWGASARANLVAGADVPVWTIGRSVSPEALRRPTRRVACLLDAGDRVHSYLQRAATLATSLRGELLVLHAVPDFAEGEIRTAPGALCADEVSEVVHRAIGRAALDVSVHVAPGGSPSAVRRLAESCAPDLLVLNPRDSLRPHLFGRRVSALADVLPCPVLFVGPEVRTRPESGRSVEVRLVPSLSEG